MARAMPCDTAGRSHRTVSGTSATRLRSVRTQSGCRQFWAVGGEDGVRRANRWMFRKRQLVLRSEDANMIVGVDSRRHDERRFREIRPHGEPLHRLQDSRRREPPPLTRGGG
jgi:hypothetical protein